MVHPQVVERGEDWSHLPFEWMEGDDDAACFAPLRADKEKLFAAAVARTVKAQLVFRAIPFDPEARTSGYGIWSAVKPKLKMCACTTFDTLLHHPIIV